MGIIVDFISLMFGNGHNGLRETVEVFRENSEAGAQRGAQMRTQAMTQLGDEFARPGPGRFDRVMDAINRLPRPALALGTLGLFVAAMVDPLWFAARMQGLTLVPEPLWWLLGVVVSFYFGARYQVKHQSFQREIATTLTRTQQVMDNLAALGRMRGDAPGAADTRGDAQLALSSTRSEPNPALADWRTKRG